MNRKRVDTNPVRRLAAFQRRLRPIPTAFDVLSMRRSCRNMNSIILDIKQRFMKPNGTEKSRTIIDKPELTSNGISTAPPADPGGVWRLVDAPILRKHELNHSRYQTKVYGAKWNQEIENNHRQTWIEDGRTSEGALERIRRHSCPLSQFTPVEIRKWSFWSEKQHYNFVKTQNDNENGWEHYALEVIDMRWIVREQSF